MAPPNGLQLTGLHHISAMTADITENRDFYTRALGMRIVKKTVNQDAPDVYHLFYADGEGQAGTDVTFFGFPNTARNYPGSGEISEVALRVPGQAALDYWKSRFDTLGIEYDEYTTRAGRTALPFRDPEGQRLALVDDGGDATANPPGTPWPPAPVPEEHAIRGLDTVSITTARPEATLRVLTDFLGFRIVDERVDPVVTTRKTTVLETGNGGANASFIVHSRPGEDSARLGYGGVHHLAFRVPTYEEHEAWNRYLSEAGFQVTPVIDRFYFKAMYFREPGGVLYELSSDEPGFATDEPKESMGEALALPPFLEPQRDQIERAIEPLDTRQAITTTEYRQPVQQES